MSFVYPMGLLGLIGIPVLILIYIILNKYTEQTIPSTYLWTLSERFLKRRLPISMIAGIISLILQILAITLISLAIAHPIVVVPNSANSYCFILDGSGSMTITQNGASRFDAGKESIEGIIKDSINGSTYTLVYSGDSAQTVFLELADKTRAIKLLNSLTCANSPGSLSRAMSMAQRYFDQNPSTITYLVTDKKYEVTENINVINVYTDVKNYAIDNVEYSLTEGSLHVTGTVASYEDSRELTVELYLQASEESETQEFYTQKVYVENFEEVPFEFECNVPDFQYFKLVVPEQDALKLDNEVVVYNVRYENIGKTLIVSDTPMFLRAALTAAGNSQLDIVSSKDYTFKTGYGLYIFDTFTPDTLPTDGSVWFVNPQGTLAGTRFNYQGDTTPRQLAKYSTSTSTFVKGMLQGVSKEDFQLATYGKCGYNGNFTSLITCEGNPVLFTGINDYGYREVVFAFSLRYSAAFTMHSDFTTLISHLLSYSFPSIIEDTMYYSGEVMQINVISGCESIVVTSPTGKNTYLDNVTDSVDYVLNDVGVYTITAVMKNQADRVCNVFAALPVEERTPFVQETSIELLGVQQHNKTDGIFDTLLTIFIILAVIAVADYGVYCYEQYQLR